MEGEIDQLLDSALDAYDAGQLVDAEGICREILAREPQHVTALHLCGIIAGQTGRIALGTEILRKLVALEPQSVEALSDLCHLLKVQGQLEAAISVGERAIGADPNSVAARNNLGEAYLSANRLNDAVACFELAIARDPGLAIVHYNLGKARQSQGRDVEAAASYRRAIALAPNFAEAQYQLGNLLRAQEKIAEAIACWRRAAAIQPESVLGRISLATALSEQGEYSAAEDCLRGAVAADPESADARSSLGEVLSRSGRFAEAASLFEQAIALQPRHTIAYSCLVHVMPVTTVERPLVDRMRSLLADATLQDQDRANLHFALGKALDDLADYERAMHHFDEANWIEANLQRLAGRILDRERHASEVDESIATFTPAFFGRNAHLGSPSELPILIVGMPRSGTTLVEQILSSHPEVGAGGELHFWSQRTPTPAMLRAGALAPAATGELAADYLALLRRSAPAASRLTDKMPQNFTFLGFIHLIFPQARVIHCRRNAVDTCLSIYFTHFLGLRNFANDRSDIAFVYEQYLRLMAHWRRTLPPDRFLEIDYEQLVADRERVSRRMTAFCGLDWDEVCLRPERNQRVVNTASKWQARQPVYTSSVGRWRHYEPWLGDLRRLLTPMDQSVGDRGISAGCQTVPDTGRDGLVELAE